MASHAKNRFRAVRIEATVAALGFSPVQAFTALARLSLKPLGLLDVKPLEVAVACIMLEAVECFGRCGDRGFPSAEGVALEIEIFALDPFVGAPGFRAGHFGISQVMIWHGGFHLA